jgi:hypothetical protein
MTGNAPSAIKEFTDYDDVVPDRKFRRGWEGPRETTSGNIHANGGAKEKRIAKAVIGIEVHRRVGRHWGTNAGEADSRLKTAA